MKKLVFICLIFIGQKLYAQKGIDTSRLVLKDFAHSLVGSETNNYKKAEKILIWLSQNFDWLYTDYKKRTINEILVRGGGNCYELSLIYMALIKEINIQYRPIAEINLHVETPQRQETAAKMVSEKGNKSSVFGFNHNDHRWIEIFNESNQDWVPADPTMGVIGLENWLKARVWYGQRITLNAELTKDMIVPIGIFVVGKDNKMIENRSHHYLIDAFNKLYQGKLSYTPLWQNWSSSILKISEKCQQAFQGEINLHEYQKDISDLRTIYQNIKKDL